MNIWFTSDNHHYHKNILKFCPRTRKGKDHIEMTELMIAKWNDQVSLGDTVYCLGDFSFTTSEKTSEILRRLNGAIYLIKGNHDNWLNAETAKRFERVSDYMEHKIDGVDVCLFHYPIMEWNKMHRDSFMLYGHVHGKDMGIIGKAMDVGIDARPQRDMGLFSWDEVRKYMKNRPIMTHHGD